MSTSKNKDNNKNKTKLSKLSNASDFNASVYTTEQQVVESQQIQPTGEQLSIVIGDVLVKFGGIMYVNTVPCIFTMFIPASFSYY